MVSASNPSLRLIQWLKGVGLLTPQQCVLQLAARPGAFDLNRNRQLGRGFDTGWYHAGLSDQAREMRPFYRFQIILLWLKSPSPLSL